MNCDCDVIRDLLPLYADRACSDRSRALVEEHLEQCPDCRALVGRLRQTELETALLDERDSVLRYGVRRFRLRSAAVGSAVSAVFVALLLVCLAANLVHGLTVSWVAVVVSALCVLASVTVVPFAVSRDKAFWTFCAFCASLVLLLGTACLYSHGDWFRIAAGAVLFGLSVIFLPFVIRARPVRELIGTGNRLMIVLGVDAALFFNLLNAVDTRGKLTLSNIFFILGAVAGILTVAYAVFRNRKGSSEPTNFSGK
ncbi:MAG: zf-HC2 domain-containing protein [Oscillospiraceae bacterium]|nr:zf-HC2 domain-containing protein [Oscillospiraceae bacterium]